MATKRKTKGKAPGSPARIRTPKLLTPDTHNAIVNAVAAGAYPLTAARAAGIREGTFERWRRDARADEAAGDDSAVCRLMADIDRADAQAENGQVADVEKPEWLLERMRPEKFGQRITIDAKKSAASNLLDLLRDELSDGAFDEVIAVLERSGL